MAGVEIDKALMMYDEKMASDDQLYGMLDKAFKEDKVNFKNPKALYFVFLLLGRFAQRWQKGLADCI